MDYFDNNCQNMRKISKYKMEQKWRLQCEKLGEI